MVLRAPGTAYRVRGLPARLPPAGEGRPVKERDLGPELSRCRLEGGDVVPLAPSGDERLGTSCQPAVVVDRWVRAPADNLPEAAVTRLLAGAPLLVRKALRLKVHVHIVEAEGRPAAGRGHVREPARETAPVQVVVESTHLLNRAIRLAPVDCIRREEMRHPVKVQLGREPPGGRLVLVFLHQDLPLGGLGQVRSVFGELIKITGRTRSGY